MGRRNATETEAVETEVVETEATETDAKATKVVVAGKIEPAVWDKAVLKGFREARVRTNSGIVEAAILAYVDGE